MIHMFIISLYILYRDHHYHLMGYLDTGNTLYDPYFNKPILIVNNNINIYSKKFIIVPFKSLNNTGVLKCFIVKKVFIEYLGYLENVLIGKSTSKFSLSGVDIILNIKLLEDKK